MNKFVLDIGGSSLKIWTSFATEPMRIESGKDFTPEVLVREAGNVFGDLEPDRVSIGYPGLVRWVGRCEPALDGFGPCAMSPCRRGESAALAQSVAGRANDRPGCNRLAISRHEVRRR